MTVQGVWAQTHTHTKEGFNNTALVSETHSVLVIVLFFEYLLLLKLNGVQRGGEARLLALYRLIERKATEQQFLPLSHRLRWNQTDK